MRIESGIGIVDASGTITIELARVPARTEWRVESIVILCSSTNQTMFMAFRDEPEPSRIIDMTQRGNFNVSDEASPKWLASGTRIVVQWLGSSALDALGNPARGECSMQICDRKI